MSSNNQQQPAFSSATALRSAMILMNQHEAYQADLERFSSTPRTHRNDDDTPTPIYDSYLENGEEVILKTTNFSPREFNSLWFTVRHHVTTNWNVGRGARTPFAGKDVFFMMLVVLKNGGAWDFLGSMFDVKGPSFERLVIKFLDMIEPILYEKYVVEIAKKFSMRKIVTSGKAFHNFPSARYAVDVTFQQSYRPSGSMPEVKAFYSKKHALYGYKVEVSVLPNGLAIGCSDHARGAMADIQMFRENLEFHRREMKKLADDANVEDNGPYLDEFEDEWCILADKGYQGLLQHVRAITPKKAKPQQPLSFQDEQFNNRIASDRIIVENYFGRLCCLWRVCSDKFRWSENLYDRIFRVCVALTNAHIKSNPLRQDDEDDYHRRCNKLVAISEDIIRKRRLSQSQYRNNRRLRLQKGVSELGGDY